MNDVEIWKVFGHIGKLHFLQSQKELEGLGVYPGQPPLLMILMNKDGLSQKQIAEKLMIKPATVNVMIKRMEKSGLVEKRQDSEDLRTSRIFLTEKGRELSKKLHELHKKGAQEYLENFSKEEKETIYNLLCKIRDNISKCTK